MKMRPAAAVALVLACTACMPAPPATPAGGPPADQPPYVDGTVMSVTPSASGAGVVVVEAADNTAAVTVTSETVVVQELGGGYEPASFAHLGPNLHVGVWITGPVRESFPVQVEATGIVIRER